MTVPSFSMLSTSRLMFMWCARRVMRRSSGGSAYMHTSMKSMLMSAQA